MAVRFSDEQILAATGAQRLREGSRPSYEAVCTDSRKLTPGSLFVALSGERFDAHSFLADAAKAGATAAVVAKGKALPPLPRDFGLFEVPDTLVALGALARFHRERFKLPVAAVTGSNGKTTTKEMVGAILATRGPALKTEGNLNNEVGVPLTLFQLSRQHVAAVLEMGMNHAGEIARLTKMANPAAGAITVVQPAHLHGLGSMDGVARAKGELFHALAAAATAVVNVDDPLIVAQSKDIPAHVLTFGRAQEAEVRLVSASARGRGLSCEISHGGKLHAITLAFVGTHNAHNAVAAFALALALGYSTEECVQGLESARPYAGRLNVLEAPRGVTVLDDSYNANPSSMAAALDTLRELAKEGRAVAVLGDMLELGDEEAKAHRELGARALEAAAVAAFFGPRLGAAVGSSAHAFTDVEPLLTWLQPQLREGDVVLVKGSRGMRLERVVDALTGRARPERAH